MKSQPDISMELSAYLDGQLPPDVAKWVGRATTASPDVARQLHDLRRIRTILRAMEPVRPEPDFVARVIAEAKRRGLMRRVVRERMVRGIFRLASAAAAVLLIATVAGVAVQSFMHKPRSTGPLSNSGPNAPAVAAAPRPGPGDGRPMPAAAKPAGKKAGESAGLGTEAGKEFNYKKDAGKAGNALLKGAGLALGEARTLNLSVADLGAGAKEVEAVLALAGIARTADGAETIAELAASEAHGSGTVAGRAGASAKPAPTTPLAKLRRDKLRTGRPAVFYRAPGDTDELRFVVVARPDRIAAVTKRLGDLRQRTDFSESSRGLCVAKVARPGAHLPKASNSSETASAARPRARSGPATEPYHIAEIRRLGNNAQADARQRQPERETASQTARPAEPGRKVLIITVRLRTPQANRADPMRNISQ